MKILLLITRTCSVDTLIHRCSYFSQGYTNLKDSYTINLDIFIVKIFIILCENFGAQIVQIYIHLYCNQINQIHVQCFTDKYNLFSF